MTFVSLLPAAVVCVVGSHVSYATIVSLMIVAGVRGRFNRA